MSHGPFLFHRADNLFELRQRVKAGQASEEERIYFNRLFGPDPHCSGWNCKRANLPPIFDLYPLTESSEEFTKERRLTTMKAYIHYGIHIYMVLNMANMFYRPAEILYCPDDDRIRPYDAATTAAFRSEIIWPLFSSTQAFLEAFQDVYYEVECSILYWPLNEPEVSLAQAKEEFEAAGDEIAVKLTEVRAAIVGYDFKLGVKTCNSIKGVDLLKPGL